MKMIFRTAVLLVTVILPFSLAADGDALAGKDKTVVCVACHANDGNSTWGGYPKIAGLGEKYLVKQIKDIKTGTRTVAEMTGMLDQLSDQDIADIAAYYNSQTRQVTGATVNSRQLTLGEKIYRGGNLETSVPACTGCHSPSGNGNAPAGYPALGGQHAEYIAKQLRAFRTGAHDIEDPSARLNDEVKVMRGVAARLNDQEIDAIANYISGLH
jgi:cytochrome c553